ncbi:MAG: hypothetical protein KDB94_11955 [Acidobacteria bacterium]|nr:hypothetical protein [Acidobacteriota bacterium]MCB9378861.1 hypothetical protein [Holophagales bacterium]
MSPTAEAPTPRALPIALILALALAVSFALGTRSYDDAYITYTFARSVAAGEGLTWQGHPGLGTSSPFLAVALGGLERALPLGIPVWGAVLSGLAGALGALALWGLGRREGWPWGGLAAGLFWLVWPGRYGHLGGEMALAVAAVAGAAWAFSARRPWSAGILLALAMLFRAECGLAAPFLAAALARRDGLSASLGAIGKAAVTAAGSVAIWAATLYALAGTVVPRTLAAKQAQAACSLGVWRTSGWRFLAEEGAWLLDAAASGLGILFALALVGAVVAARRKLRFGSALALWGVAHLGLLALLGVPRYTWYVEPFRFALLVAAGMGVSAPGSLAGRSLRRARWTVAVLVLVLLGLGIDELVGLARREGDTRRAAYGEIVEAADAYPEGTSLAAYEVGYLGFSSRQPVLDLLGLVTPEVSLDAVRRGDFAAIRRSLDPDLLVVPVAAGPLGPALLGDPGSFLAEYRLDRLVLGRDPNLALYRRATLEGRGPVVRDLLPDLEADGGRVDVRMLEAVGGLVLRLAPGERRVGALPAGAGGELVFAAGAETAGGSLHVDLGVSGESGRLAEIPLDAAGHWTFQSIPVAPDVLPRSLAFACAEDGGADCLVGIPHLSATR